MPIIRINELPEGSGNLTNDDIFIFMDDPSDSGVTKKISLSEIAGAIGGGGVSISNSGDNRILTSTGTSTGINAESNLTFDGTTLAVSGVLDIDNIRIDGNTISSTNSNGNIVFSPNGNGNITNYTNNSIYRLQKSTANNTPAILTIDGNSPGSTNRLTVPAKTTLAFTANISAYNDTDSIGGAWIFRGTIRRNNSNTTAIIGSPIEENWLDSGMASTIVTVSADDTNEALQIEVTGLGSKNIQWVAIVNICQITYT